MKKALLAALLASSYANAVFADTAVAEKFSCDTPGGRYSRYQRPLDGASARAAAIVSFNDVREGTDWLPVTNIMLNGGTVESRVGFRLLPNKRAGKTRIFVVFPGMAASEASLVGEADWKAPLRLEITTNDQATTASVNGTSRTGKGMVSPQLSLDLSCSSIDAHIDGISVATN